ncbi:porin [Geotalea sp. SG265]|uniref:OprO/OprP family phosphate-selective porin n=1 Tax=Geotalea sp. SG265 TaxID=2922867 RepID=UPI001FAF2AFD|nr:porin [Geotalea sp. SG265]
MGKVRTLIGTTLTLVIMGTAGAVLAEETPARQAVTVEERIQELDRKLQLLEERRGAEQAQKNSAGEAIVGAGKDGFYLKSSNGNYQLKLRGYVQADGRFFANSKDAGTDQFLVRRVRPIIEGTIAGNFDFRIMPDFGNGKTELQDAYLDIRFLPELKLRGGKFKAPVGLERLQSGTDILFVERGLPTNLVPNRDVGFQLHGEAFQGGLSYAFGVFNGVADGASADGDGGNDKEFAGRIFFRPFKTAAVPALSGLGLGIGGSYGDTSGTLPSFKTPAQEKFFSYRSTTSAGGNHYRVAPQGYYYWNALGILGEYVLSSQDAANGSRVTTLKNDAWQGVLSYVLTGEKASYKGVVPRNAFDLQKGTFGAFQVAVRYGRLNIDRDAFPVFADPAKSARSASSAGGGVNWYLNNNVKVAFDYEQTDFHGGAATGKDREDEKIFLSRFQIAF